MPLTQEKRLDSNFTNNNDHNYLHKKFKKMASTIAVFPVNPSKGEETRYTEVDVAQTASNTSISNGSIAAAHPEIEKIKQNQHKHILNIQGKEKNVQTNFNIENTRLSDVNDIIQVPGQTSFTNEFSNKTENLENDFIREAHNGATGGRNICPYCKLSCAKPSVLQKHIRAHTNERPYPCEPCGFAFKTKSNLYKHRRSRTHALRLQGADVSATINDEDLSGGSESDTSLPSMTVSDNGSEVSVTRFENLLPNEFSSPELAADRVSPPTSMYLLSGDSNKSKTIYKPKFRAKFFQESDDKDKSKKTISPNAEFLTEHISKIISDNEAIVDVIETPLQKKYGKIKQIAERKQFLNDSNDIKSESSPLNLTKAGSDNESSFRKRSHSESFSQIDHQKHPLNPEGSIIKDLLLKTQSNGVTSMPNELMDGLGPVYTCPLCPIIYRSAENLEAHRLHYCKGSINNTTNSINTVQKDIKVVRPEHVFMRSNSINVRLPETQSNPYAKLHSTKSPPLRNKPDNLVIIKPESNEVVAPLPSPGPLLGNTRLVDSRAPPDYRKADCLKIKPVASPKRRIDNRSDAYSPRLTENISPRPIDLYSHSKIRCIENNSSTLRSLDEISQHMRQNSTSLQMFGGEVKIVNKSGSTTTLRIEPSKNQLSPILIQQNNSPSKLCNDGEASSVVVRSGLHSGGTIVHNPPTPKGTTSTPQPQTPRISISTVSGITNSNIQCIHDVTHFQFPPLSAITAFNPLTLPPLSPSSSPNGPTTILHGGKLIPHVPGMPGPNTPGTFVGNPSGPINNIVCDDTQNKSIETIPEGSHGSFVSVNMKCTKGINASKYEIRSARSPNLRTPQGEPEKQNKPIYNVEMPHYTLPIIKVKNVDEPNIISKGFSPTTVKSIIGRQDGAVKRNSDGFPRTPILKETINYTTHRNKSSDKINVNVSSKNTETKTDDIRNFNFENLITKAEIYTNQIQSSSEVQKNSNVQETAIASTQNERSETSYFQKNNTAKTNAEERKPKFLRPSSLPLKPGTFTPKRHHGITPNANTMPLVSPETPRPAKAYGQLYLNGNAYTYLGLKCSTKVFYCTINRPQPTYVPNQHFLSMYSNWQLLSELTPDLLGLSASSAMSLYDSRHRPQNVAVAVIKQDLILTHSSQWNINSKDNKQAIPMFDSNRSEDSKFQPSDSGAPKKEVTGGFESNEEYTYVRGRGRGRYVCSECGIRCKKPSMLKKHIRTHTDVRPYTCTHCAFSFKTKGNLTKHMKSKAHYKKCSELGINPNEGNDVEGGETAQCSGETDDDTESDADEGNEGETESSDTEICKSRLPEHEAAHCLLSLGGSRPATSSTPGLITSARPSTYPYTPVGLESSLEQTSEGLQAPRTMPVDSSMDVDNEPMDLSKNDIKITANIPEIPTARESSILASLASNTAKLPQYQTQWSNGEPMLHTYLTERALLDSKIKQSQLTTSLIKLRKIDPEKAAVAEKDIVNNNDRTPIVSTIKSTVTISTVTSLIAVTTSVGTNDIDNGPKSVPVSKEENSMIIKDFTLPTTVSNEPKRSRTCSSSNAENAKYVVSEYLKHARINHIKTYDNTISILSDNLNEASKNTNITNTEDKTKLDDVNISDTESLKLPNIDHDSVAPKVVIGAGGVAFKVTKGKEYDGTPPYSPGRLMEDGRRVCDFCNKTFTKPSQLRLHLNIHYMERPFRCSACAVSFRTRGHLQKHERSGSHHNKVSMTSTFGAATSLNPRPFGCSDCNIAFRIHGHLAKHLRSKMHVMRLECLFKLPFGTFTEIERAGVSLTDIDTTDCASSLASLQSLARKLHEKDPSKLEYREPGEAAPPPLPPPPPRDSSEDEDAAPNVVNTTDSVNDSDIKTMVTSECQDKETRVNYSATD